ncbi:hypothetical protein [Arabidopsis thaliana]|uniref:Transmembrane protein n=2 Tax=Arabidopsis thaliana TaxID=3702 RepID=Q9SNA1_ARATH|nr:uncharacterized protein AT3G46360 [Arabidopsis thaliana]AEE78150.1 transmembrane protein [Arabidopsis thaliana]CAB62027.1 hypothetical protein [Arabidopsis thaliana]VYS59526.1 unnamed protein product [Arabidopsis thaliana]|eukprot:NP_190220.1 transmembrane protein [Arabidopsis thaliana]
MSSHMEFEVSLDESDNRGLATLDARDSSPDFSGELLNLVLVDGAVSGSFSGVYCSGFLLAAGSFTRSEIVVVHHRDSSDIVVSLLCVGFSEALGFLFYGGQCVSSFGGLLRVVASSAMVMASPCPFVFVPDASSPVVLRSSFVVKVLLVSVLVVNSLVDGPWIVMLVATRMKIPMLRYCGNNANFRASWTQNRCFSS